MWNQGPLLRILVCIGVFGVLLYAYVDRQNEVTRRRLEIPVLAKEIKDLEETNTHLQYEIDLFENPEHLMELARHSEYSYLKQSMLREVLTMSDALALEVSPENTGEKTSVRPKLKFAIGAKQ
jgi:hypothetical protein